MEETDLEAIKKGRLSLADALKQIETVTKAFKQAERIEKQLSAHEFKLQEMRNAMDTFASIAFVSSKFEEFTNRFESLIKQKFEDFSTQYLFQLNEKMNLADAESLISQRVT